MNVVVIGAGISGLSSAFRIQEAASAAGVDLHLVVLEREATLGGTLQTDVDDGWRVEGGPNGFLDSKPTTLALVRDIAAEDRLLPSDSASKVRFIYSTGKLRALPTSPPKFLTAGLMPLSGLMRIALEPFQKKGPPDETLYEFGRRRLGRHAVERLLDPFVAGVFAGDVEQLSVAAAFPAIKSLEQEYGGLVKGMRARAKERKAAGGASSGGGPAGPGGHLNSMMGGMGELIALLSSRIRGEVRTGAGVASVTRAGDGYEVRLQSGETLGADVVVVAAPAYAGADFLAPLDEELAKELAAIPYAAAAVVGTGFERSKISHPLAGFGFLIPSRERRDILGVLWTSSIYPGHRAPDGHVLLRTIVGGARRPDMVELSDDELLARVQAEHAATMGIHWDTPEHLRIFRWRRAIPQYPVGHVDRIARLEAIAARHPGLLLAGNWLRGVGLNDCTRESERVGAEFAARLAG